MTADHQAIVETYRVPVRTKAGNVKRYQQRHIVRCSCGQPLGFALDYIDARRVWREHQAAVSGLELQQGGGK